jgi:hypothetical protein
MHYGARSAEEEPQFSCSYFIIRYSYVVEAINSDYTSHDERDINPCMASAVSALMPAIISRRSRREP